VQFPELFTIPADDGFPMPAEIMKPKDFRPERKYPVVMFVYGGASAQQVINAWQGDTMWNQLLLDAGYVVVKVDNRSATGISVPLAKQLHGNLLIVYGTYDDNVHPYNEMAFIDGLITAGKKFQMMAYPMRKHGIADQAATLHLYGLMLDFWKANL